MNRFILWFVKITGIPFQWVYFNKRVYYEDNNKKYKKIPKGSLLVCNHTSLYDYALCMFLFYFRNIRVLVSEVMYTRRNVAKFMKALGGIKVDRKNFDFSFMKKSIEVLQKGKTALIFPESKLPEKKEPNPPLREFKPSYVYMALESGAPIIPLYTNGMYGTLKKKYHDRARVIIGKPIDANSLWDDKKTEKENIAFINNYVSGHINLLKEKLNNEIAREKEKQKK